MKKKPIESITLQQLRESTETWKSIKQEAHDCNVTVQCITWRITQDYYIARDFCGVTMICESEKGKLIKQAKAL